MYECGLDDRQELEIIQNLILDRIRYLREKEADLTNDGIVLDYYSKNDEILNCILNDHTSVSYTHLTLPTILLV